MNLICYSDKINDYLKQDAVIDYNSDVVAEAADTLFQNAAGELDIVKTAFEFIRDQIPHSADINEDALPCAASEVLKAGHGICFAKAHLLAALLRYKSVPAGFCYQKLILDDETAPVLAYHGLNAVYLKDVQRWIRIDAGVKAPFSAEPEQLVLKLRTEKGEKDALIAYPDPDKTVLEKIKLSGTRTRLWVNLPTELDYDRPHQHPV